MHIKLILQFFFFFFFNSRTPLHLAILLNKYEIVEYFCLIAYIRYDVCFTQESLIDIVSKNKNNLIYQLLEKIKNQ